MTTHLFTNNATGSLASDITALAVSLSLGVGEGALFPNPVSGESFRVTIFSGSLYEIVEVTARSSDAFTISRAQEGTIARAWSAGTGVQLRLTAEQLEDIQTGKVSNAAIGALTPAADRLPYFTGASAAALATFTSFARTLLACASASAVRAALSAASLTTSEGLSNKAITASSLDSSPVGATVASTGAFTTLSSTSLTTTGAVSFLPTGIICMWSGAISAIPTGWALCDGTNGTPDLRDRFVIGARQDETSLAKTNVTGALTQSGGSKDAIAVSHTHTATSAVTDPGHAHEILPRSRGQNQGVGNYLQTTSSADPNGSLDTGSKTTGITVATTVETAGASGTNANLPPYYALAFIMRL